MFQWVKCQIQVLCSLGTDKAILKALEQMPKDLAGTYTRILQRLERDGENLKRYQKLLRWLVRSNRSLTLDELAECIGIDLDEDNESMDFDSVETYPRNLLKRCGSLLTVSDDGRVSLAHYTIKEFLTSESARTNLKTFYVGKEDVEAELAQTCLTYLCYSDFTAGVVAEKDTLLDTLDKYKFLEYASKNWGMHTQNASGMEANLVDIVTFFLKSSSEGRGNFDFWLQLCQFLKTSRHFDMSTLKPSFFAASYGLSQTLGNLLEDEDESDFLNWSGTENDPIREAATHGHADVVGILLEHYNVSDEGRLAQYLYAACSYGHVSCVQTFLDKGASPNTVGGRRGTGLQVAVLEGHKDVVRLLLARGVNLEIVNAKFGTPLSAAAEMGHERIFQMLLNAGASIHGKGGWYAYPLISAIIGQNDTIIQILLNKGVDVNLVGGHRVCALMAAAALGNISLVQKLIDIGARVNDENDKQPDALYSACAKGHLNVVELLLKHDADANGKGGKHRNALNAASSGGFLHIVEVLLSASADPAAFDPNRGNALQAAARSGHVDIVRKLAENGCDVNVKGGIRGTALVGAASAGQARTAEVLIELGVLGGANQETADALVAVTAKQHRNVIKVLVSVGANLNAAGIFQMFAWLPLQQAAIQNDIEMVSTLLELGADPNAIGGFLGTALLAATQATKIDCHILESLIAAGADVNQLVPPEQRSKHPEGWYGESTPLSAAARAGQRDAVRLLLSHAADPEMQCGDYGSAIQKAAYRSDTEILEMLIAHGANVNLDAEPCYLEGDDRIITPLQGASAFAGEATVRLLIASGAKLSIEREDSSFKSALHAASFYGNTENVKVILELGGDVNLRGGYFGTSLQAAAIKGHLDVMAVLLDAGAIIDEQNVGCHGSALVAAIVNLKHEAVRLLLDRGVDPALRTGSKFQYPIIAAACIWGNGDEVQLLIDAGADVNACGGINHTALQAATVNGNDRTIGILLNAGADINAMGGRYGNALSIAYRQGYYLCTALLWERGVSNE